MLKLNPSWVFEVANFEGHWLCMIRLSFVGENWKLTATNEVAPQWTEASRGLMLNLAYVSERVKFTGGWRSLSRAFG